MKKLKLKIKRVTINFYSILYCLKAFLQIIRGITIYSVDFDSKDIVDKYKGKKVDLYGAYYGYQCAGGTPNKTACMYGGVTLHDNNRLTEEKKCRSIYG